MDHHEQESEERGLPLQHVVTDTSDRRVALGFLSLAAVVAGLALFLILAIDDAPMLLVIILAAVALGALVGAWLKIRVWAGWSNPQLFLPSSEPLHLGDTVVVRFKRVARGRSDTTGLDLSARLRVEERATYQRGTDTHTATDVIFERDVQVVLGDVVDRTVEADLLLDIPVYDAPPSFDTGNNEVHWELVVDMAAPNAPDDESTFTIDVDPEISGRLHSGSAGR